MLSFAGETEPLNGVGEGSGKGTKTVTGVREDRTVLVAAPLANAKVLSDKPATQARAHVLTATFL
jgi:hypothetical protein